VGTYPEYARWNVGRSRQAAFAALRGSGEHMSMPQGGESGQGDRPDWGDTGGPPAGYGTTPQSPVNLMETRVTGKRVIQYIFDYVVTAIVASLISWVMDRGTGATNGILVAVSVLLDIAWYFWYWVYRPYRANGQSFGMQLIGLRVISKSGGPATMMQLFIRAVLLIIDTIFFGLVGWITIICSTYRQRVGDHAAKTLVVRAYAEPAAARQDYAGAGQAGSR
jgi:uncharacterized RDD family membrane protein YckC